MKPTLYEALGLSRTATEAEIKSALRRLVRRYYTKTRAGNADVEEALRFLNHASHILGNSARRAEYDATLVETARASSSSMTTIGGTFQAEIALPGETELGDVLESLSQLDFARDRPPPAPELAPELSSQLADIRRTPAGQLAALGLMALVLVGAWVLSAHKGGAASLVGYTVTLLAVLAVVAAGVFGVVHLLSRSIWKLPAPENALTLVEGMIPRWRKDRTVFLGTGAPVEDATWLFRLRMAELKRVKAERVSDPRPATRLLARLFDYSVWGLAYAGIVTLLASAGLLSAGVAGIALHPLVAPIMITLTWVALEALMLAHLQTTPGRWLLCVYLQHGVSNPYAPEELRFTFRTAAARAFDVWWRGCAAWLPIVSLITVARARERVKRSGETRWDSQRDCLVTHGPVGRMSFVTLGFGLLACAVVYAALWRQPIVSLWGNVTRSHVPATAPREAAKFDAPIVSAQQGRISRLDDVQPPQAGAPPTLSIDEGKVEPAPTAPPPLNNPPLSPSIASNRAMAVENSQPAAVSRVGEAPSGATGDAGSASLPAASSAPAGSTLPPAPSPPKVSASGAAPATGPVASTAASAASAASAAKAPGASAPELASSSVQPGESPDTTPAEPSTGFSPKAFFANLFRKSQPVEPAAPPPPVEEPKPPTAAEIRDRRNTDFLRQAQRQQSTGDYAGLIRTCTRWTEEDFKNARAFFCWGLGLQGTGQHKQAIAMFNKAGSLLPRDDPLKQQISDAVIRSFRAQGGN